ncbi:MAG: hypothetical protein BWY10_00826 [Chloroflexi bacterium ADurb.Bin180]|nr:MAG: hypothetical protein BWY10_00826 [Chloroflexi bacterium ADurb.Bin180]
MRTDPKPLVEITQSAIRVLVKELGVVDTIRFVNQFTPGYGDYTAERQDLLAGLSLDEIVSAIKQDAARGKAKARR